jgi:hypothetical protein
MTVMFPQGKGNLECYDDTDCPGAAICAINQTWMDNSIGAKCMCLTKYGFTGPLCKDWCAQGNMIMAVNSLVVIIAVCILFSAIVVIHKARKSLPWWPLTPVMVTLIFVVCGSVFLGFGATLGLIRTVGFATFFIVMQDETGRELRRIPPAIEYVRNSMFSLGYCLTMGVAVVLPLIWLDLAEGALKLRRSQAKAITLFSVFFLLLLIIFQVPLYILVASSELLKSNNWSFAVIGLWSVVNFFVIILNILALIRVTKARRNSSHLDQRIDKLMSRIQITSVQLIILAVATVILLSYFDERLRRGFYSQPDCYLDGSDVAIRLARATLLYNCALALWFITPYIEKKAPDVREVARPADDLTEEKVCTVVKL